MSARPLITVRGKGPDLVLLHGWAMASGAWGVCADELAQRWRLHLVDLPGHGDAQRGAWTVDEVVNELLEQTPPAAWLGWSLGGMLALAAAIRAPAQVHALVVLASTPRFVASPDWPEGMDGGVFEQFATDFQVDPQATVRRFKALVASGVEQPARLLRDLRELPPTCPEALACGLRVLRETDFVAALPGLRQAALWIGGAGDQITPAAASHAAAVRMPRGRSFIIETAGHAPQLSHPLEVAALVNDFLLAEAAA